MNLISIIVTQTQTHRTSLKFFIAHKSNQLKKIFQTSQVMSSHKLLTKVQCIVKSQVFKSSKVGQVKSEGSQKQLDLT